MRKLVLAGAAAVMMCSPLPARSARLFIPAAQSRAATDRDDWVQMLPVRGTVVGQEDCDRPMLSHQTLSLDGGFAYQQVCRWVTSDDIIQVRLADGFRREVAPGNSVSVIRSGQWRGFLLIEQHRRPQVAGIPSDATWVVRPDGKNMFPIPGSRDGNRAAVQAWLYANHWTAD